MMSKPLTFMIAILYGVCWVVGPLNLLAAALTIGEGRNPLGFVPTIIISFGIILLVHKRFRWFPYNRPIK